MLTNNQIEDLRLASRNDFEFARACELAGRREQQKLDAELARKYPFSPVIDKNIADAIERAE